jgi:signal peptidase I
VIRIKRLWKNDYAKTIVAIVLIVALMLVFFFGSKYALNVSYGPIVVVESGSMCVPYGVPGCVGWNSITHPFAHTLHTGDVVIIQGVNPKDLKTDYPNSDIIVFYDPNDPTGTPIIHRIIKVTDVNGTLYFETKGDGNGNPGDQWPQTPTSGQDPWDFNNPPGVPQNLVIGKVDMRIPWFGWIALIMQRSNWGLPLIITLIMILVIVEFVIPILRENKKVNNKKKLKGSYICIYKVCL